MTTSRQFADRTFRRVYPNGLTLLVLENPANPTVEIRGALRAGLYFETAPPYGSSRFTASMLMRGSRRHSKLELARRLEDVGADLDTSAGRFLVSVSGRSLKKDLDLLLETVAEVLQEPAFPDEEIERLRTQVIGSLRRSQEDTAVRAYDRLAQLIYPPESPFFRPASAERIAAVESTQRADLERFHGGIYGARTLILVIVGDVNAADCDRWVGERFGVMGSGADRPIDVPRTLPRLPATAEWVEMADKSSVDVLLGHAGHLRRADAPYYAAMLGNAALGQSTLSSRLGRRVRDQEGLSYGIVSRFFEATYADGPWGISVTVNPENVEKAITSTREVLNQYLAEGITREELEHEKTAFVGSFIVALDTNAGIASHLLSAEAFGFGPAHLDHYPDLVKQVSLNEVNDAIHTFFKPDALFTVMAGQPSKRS